MQPKFLFGRMTLSSVLIGFGCGFLRVQVPQDGSEILMPIVSGSMIGFGVFWALALVVDLTKR